MIRLLRYWLLLTAFIPVLSGAQIERNVRGEAGNTRLNAADSLFLENRIGEADHALDSLVSLQPENAMLHYNKGLTTRLLDRGSGLRHFRRSFQLSMDPPGHIHWMYGVALTDEDSLEAGEDHLRQAIRLRKDFYEASVSLGRNLRLQRRSEEAIDAIHRAFGQERNYVLAYTELAAAYRDIGQHRDAFEALRDGYRRFPYEQILVELVRMHDALSDADSVFVYGEEYLRMYPKGPHVHEVVGTLNRKAGHEQYHVPDEYRDIAFAGHVVHPDPAEVLPVGRRLHYKVKYGFITLGTLVIDVLNGEYNGEPTWRVQYTVRSNPTLPFVDIHDVFRVHLSHDISRTVHYEAIYDEEDYNAVTVYDSDQDTGWFYDRTVEGDGSWYYIEHPLPPNAYDSSSMMWYAQKLVIWGSDGVATNEISSGFERTIIDVNGSGGRQAFGEEEYNTIYVDGIMRYAGVAGLTGDYEGWFMADAPYWPLRAKFKIFLGSISIVYNYQEPTPLPEGPDW